MYSGKNHEIVQKTIKEFEDSVRTSNGIKNNKQLMEYLLNKNIYSDEFFQIHIQNFEEIKSNLMQKYQKFIIPWTPEEEQNGDFNCDVCFSSNSYDDNQIVICDLCNSATHQACYGGDLQYKVPEGNWFCMRCKFLILTDLQYNDIRCFFCPEIKGVIKKVQGNLWVHCQCVNWIDEIEFEDESKQKISVWYYDYDRHNIVCEICKIKYGACNQCDQPDCYFKFHITCALQMVFILVRYD